MTPFHDALEQARLYQDFAALADLLRSGYRPTPEECDALADFTPDVKRRTTTEGIKAKAHAVLRAKELRSAKWSRDDAIAKVAAEFDIHPASVRNAVLGKDAAVNRLLTRWAMRGAKNVL
jgi:hypothetical protein